MNSQKGNQINPNKYPSLEWCDKYGHLFPDSDCVMTAGKGIIPRGSSCWHRPAIANCPDALEIIKWLWNSYEFQVSRFPEIGNYFILVKGLKVIEKYEALNHLEALMQAVELVEAV